MLCQVIVSKLFLSIQKVQEVIWHKSLVIKQFLKIAIFIFSLKDMAIDSCTTIFKAGLFSVQYRIAIFLNNYSNRSTSFMIS